MMIITIIDDTTDKIIISCLVSSLSLGGDKTTKLEYYVIRGCHLLIHLTV